MSAEGAMTNQAVFPGPVACFSVDNLSSLVNFSSYCDKKYLAEATLGRKGSWGLTLSGDTGCLCGEGGRRPGGSLQICLYCSQDEDVEAHTQLIAAV